MKTYAYVTSETCTIRKAVRKMASIDKLMNSPSFNNISKKERLTVTRERAKLEKNLSDEIRSKTF